MVRSSVWVSVLLDEERAQELARLARQAHTDPDTMARFLLTTAVDQADSDPADVTALLDGIDGAWERASAGLREARANDAYERARVGALGELEVGFDLGSDGHVPAREGAHERTGD